MVDLMSLEEQVDKEFAVVRRRARIRRLKGWLRGRAGTGTLLPFEATRRSVGACGGVRRQEHRGGLPHRRQRREVRTVRRGVRAVARRFAGAVEADRQGL